MKKQMKKLVLAKETVRDLSRVELGGIAGGTFITGLSCNCTFQCWSSPTYPCQQEVAPEPSSIC